VAKERRSRLNSPVHISKSVCASVVSTLWMTLESTWRTGVFNARGMAPSVGSCSTARAVVGRSAVAELVCDARGIERGFPLSRICGVAKDGLQIQLGAESVVRPLLAS
jgi:hypothetical protein